MKDTLNTLVGADRTITVVRADGKEFTGKLVLTEDGRYSVRTGKRGRPVRFAADEVAEVKAA